MEQANNVSQFLNILERYRGYEEIFFRGQSSMFTTINSSLSRDPGYTSNEYEIYCDSVRLKKEEFKTLTSPIYCLAKMQHYRIPTRLVDFTINPLIALFFSVQDVDTQCDSCVYVYITKGKSIDSKHVRLLSLLATIKEYDFKSIQKNYFDIYDHPISKEEIIDLTTRPVFIKYTENLGNTNPRLKNQEGTFAICSNNINNEGVIKGSINSLDSDIQNTLVIRVPYEYKKFVKQELDEKYRINETFIYPELPSVADYIREKYKHVNFSIDGTYSIVETENVSYGDIRRTSITIVLERALLIQQIKEVGKSVIDTYKTQNDVVWLYIARNGEDYTMFNWVLRGQWINPSLESKFRPLPIGEPEGIGHYWKEGNNYSTLSDFYEKQIFEDDKKLYVYNEKVLSVVQPLYKELSLLFKTKSMEEFTSEFNNDYPLINKMYRLFEDFGPSRSKEFNKFLSNYYLMVAAFDQTHYWINDNDISLQSKVHQVSNCFQEIEEHLAILESERDTWRINLNVSETDYETIDPYNISKGDYQYTQTIPVDSDALVVKISLDICVNADNSIQVTGKTNLYDSANLLLTIEDASENNCGSNNAEVLNGVIDFGIFNRNGKGFEPGTYKAKAILSIPSTQHHEFVTKAGTEYEKLTGPYMDRTGIGPTLKYESKFIL